LPGELVNNKDKTRHDRNSVQSERLTKKPLGLRDKLYLLRVTNYCRIIINGILVLNRHPGIQSQLPEVDIKYVWNIHCKVLTPGTPDPLYIGGLGTPETLQCNVLLLT
jgi:hypothetical protein